MPMPASSWRYLTLCMVMLAATAAHAQTGPALLLQPTPEALTALVHAEYVVVPNNTNRQTQESDTWNIVSHSARVRLPGSEALERDLLLGHRIRYIDANLPQGVRRGFDQSLALGTDLFTVHDWRIQGIVGIGTATTNPYTDSDGLYFMGDLIATRVLDEKSTLQIYLNYHGNRSIFPDIPLPGIAYIHQYSPTLRFTVGTVVSSVQWQMTDELGVELGYYFPSALFANIHYDLHEHWRLYASYGRDIWAFHVDGTGKSNRIFIEQSRAELGLRWKPCDQFDLSAGFGLAFGQRVTFGRDTRNDTGLVKFDNDLFLSLRANLRF